ncbi:DEAD/DEAH box helicase [Metabacillus sp. JX24]|uniref:DEAD/DEAH box helicase n=1 Tax=Metabacillus sp. JX24 TaxID=3240759 RepID=UPI003510812F
MKNGFSDYKLSSDLLKALDKLSYNQPTEVQKLVIPAALQQKDLVVKSQTGSGKTAAFGIPLCELVEWEENKPQALVLTPTRELAAQIKEDLTNIGRFKRIKAAAIYGKQPFERQKIELKQKTHIVAGTPGRVLDHIEKGTFPLEKLRFLIIDEADEMLNMGFIDQVAAIMEELPKERISMLFSATLPDDVEKLCDNYMNDPVQIEIKASGLTTSDIDHSLITVSEDDKFSLAKAVTVIENPDSCILFCRTQERVDLLERKLSRAGYPCGKIHGGLVQEDRFSVMYDFKKGAFRYLIATDVAARGIDVDNVSLVINYDLPLEKESYVHRTGRTGRAGKKGKAITFSVPNEERMTAEIEDYIGFAIRRTDAPTHEETAAAKPAFEKKLSARPAMKKDKSAQLNKGIMKLYFNGGKKKKIRAIDFVGTISNLPGITADDIGIISIQENVTYVDILNGKGPAVLKAMKTTTVKGKLLKVHEARK